MKKVIWIFTNGSIDESPSSIVYKSEERVRNAISNYYGDWREISPDESIDDYYSALCDQYSNVEENTEMDGFDFIFNLKEYVIEIPEIEVKVMVEGGIVQGASVNNEAADFGLKVGMDVYDMDCIENDEDYIENNGTPEEWDEMIKERTTPIL